MNHLKYACCLCLSLSNKPLNDLNLKSKDDLSHFQKITSTLSQLATVMSQAVCDFMICLKCCDTIEMIYKFNNTCLQNLEIFLSQDETARIISYESNKTIRTFVETGTQTNFDASASANSQSGKTNVDDFSNLMDICEINLEVEDSANKRLENQKHNSQPADAKAILEKPTLEEAILDDKNEEPMSSVKEIRTKIKEYQCDACKKTFKQKYNFKRHIQNHLIEKQYACNVCSKTFGRKDVLERHKLIHFDEKQYTCNLCNKSFRQKAGLFQHKLTHSEERPYACDQCDKQFKGKYELIKHKRVHTGEEPYVCEQCGKGFKQLANLIDHRRKHTGERPHACKECNESFKYKYQLVQHNKNLHTSQVLTSSDTHVS